MAAPIDEVTHMGNKSLKKINKKQTRAKHKLLKHDGIHTVPFETNHLVVFNGGLDNGVDRHQLEDVFTASSGVIQILMLPGKSYSFVTFSTTSLSKACFELVNGQTFRFPGRASPVTFYLDYVENVPGMPSTIEKLPPGLVLLHNFITTDEEAALLAHWDKVSLVSKQDCSGKLKHRQVKHYGYEFIYGENLVDPRRPMDEGIPHWCTFVIDRLLDSSHVKHYPDQLTINHYKPGQGIPPHIDTHSAFEDEIISLSLGSQVIMDFKHPNGCHVPVLLPRRSIAIMTGESRYVWTHGITPRKSDIVPMMSEDKAALHSSTPQLTLSARETRTSLTFRKILTKPCTCAYPEQCDSQRSENTDKKDNPEIHLPRSSEEAEMIEEDHVHKVYEQIAGHFSATRHTPWPKVVNFIKRQKDGSIIADVGCGNGKYLGVNSNVLMIGCDRSVNLCSICLEHGHQVFVGDALHVPLRSKSVDAVISIAVIHHMSTQERRLSAIKELVRLLRPGGQCLISVWAFEQELGNVKSNYLCESKMTHRDSDETNSELRSLENIVDESNDLKKTGNSQLKESVVTKDQPDDAEMSLCNKFDGATINSDGDDDNIINHKSKTSSKIDLKREQMLSLHVNRTNFQSQDVLVPWHRKTTTLNKHQEASQKDLVCHRFYHVFSQGELEYLCSQIANVDIVESYYDKGNWCVILTNSAGYEI